MQRWTGYILAALLAASIVLVVLKAGPRANGADAGATVSGPDAGAAARASDGGAATDGGTPELSFDAGQLADAEAPDTEATDAGGTLINGEAAPAVPGEAPKSVVFGVVLVQYKGAQGAAPTTRSREEALQLAKDIAATAKDDFKAAVAKGDKGSMENAGRIPRGVLEPAPEYVVFSLPKGGVSEPVDTPRGYWIVHRIE